ncbi:MAG TPA: hypothetical protein VFI22_04135, partial [Thermomicrobiales bacterium]|nr:hypothetical protein [Thermomicrobiales bacterium]
VPLTPISTGTNNVFPSLVEGTLAGLAAGFVATGVATADVDRPRVIERRAVLRVAVDGAPRDIALVDVVTTAQSWVGARAIWDARQMRQIVLSRVIGAAIGIASLGGILFPEACGGCSGAAIELGGSLDSESRIVAPLAPGLIAPVAIKSARLIHAGDVVDLGSEPTTVALDGERELRIPPPGAPLSVTLDPLGPRVVNIANALVAGARSGAFDAARLSDRLTAQL